MGSYWTRFTMTQVEQAIENALGMSGGPSASLIHQASRTLTNDEFLHLPSTYIEAVPTPGATRRLTFNVGEASFLFDPGAYLIGPDAFLLVVYGEWDCDASAPVELSSELDGANTALSAPLFPVSYIRNVDTDVPGGRSWVKSLIPTTSPDPRTNKPLKVAASAGGDFTGGDPADIAPIAFTFLVYDETLKRFLTTVESGWDEATRTFN